MKAVTPQTSEWVDDAPAKITRSLVVNASPSTIWDILVANEEWPEWFPGFRSCEFSTAAPHGVGSVRLLRQDQFRVEERIITWDPGREWGMTVIGMNVPVVSGMAENVRLTPVDGATTEVQWDIGVALRWWSRPLRPFLVGKSDKQLQLALTALAERAHAARPATS